MTLQDLFDHILAFLSDLPHDGNDEVACAVAEERKFWERLAEGDGLLLLAEMLQAQVEEEAPTLAWGRLVEVRNLLWRTQESLWNRYDQLLEGDKRRQARQREEVV